METGAARFRNLLQGGDLIVAPGAFDPYTARIIESLGFPAVYMGGNAVGTHLGTGEPLTTMTETIDCALRVLRAIEVPLVMDADAGFGDPVHTYRTVREFERAGVAAIHIEDQPFPKRAHYHKGMGRVTPLEEMLPKLRAAVDARRDRDFVIIGRTDTLRVTHSFPDTLERCRAYVAAGVDMLMVMGASPEDMRALRRELPSVPQVWLSGLSGDELSVPEIRALGVSLLIYPVTVPVVVTQAVLDVLTRLRDTGRLGLSEEYVTGTRNRILELIGIPKYWEFEEQTTERG
ncbi:MAG TPA: isocitrate lyase/PEP mutase family protein [Candidatus Dormibacteraeota bacterium]|nr:isocitrate lyase/PEP mutase family protein [Candidatus Dormibacteraeota bacterium]